VKKDLTTLTVQNWAVQLLDGQLIDHWGREDLGVAGLFRALIG